ncbi:hypothetical protein HUG10_09740 [Halorarum halophilum]|uniref:Small CPxCG-related zinc finger protein n=1 Tax=Halorarum halophilum TaxID=2743090 RepID=A0A7D5KFS5_9EURY|nr:hypothetical protein [Halobaculum halophilum]QLG27816.1 hypothetical protein HUG10_09740 [Halobaculum halophilum]
MSTEPCGVCGDPVPFASAVHVVVHTRTEDGVVDHYLCRGCYERDVEPLFA